MEFNELDLKTGEERTVTLKEREPGTEEGLHLNQGGLYVINAEGEITHYMPN